ncbi:type II toxin-antitoxin system VapC family toxin [Ruania suaedae]|uniref:PIN domain-containing protein n=1 Tax=Ruania suaedae TaxID=2897774 RepID=UPI001E43B393|nr:type II toxin-antitoxin system VapC family toxin [Ruania suaedae]UFU01848.1 type II toxin-antitoxin system VapC family toxin [Ruania suaedae]
MAAGETRLVGIDTNVLLRYLLRDDDHQFRLADEVFGSLTAQEPGFITHVTLAEVYWVLTRSVRLHRARSLAVIRQLVETDCLEFEDGETVVRALDLAEQGADFPDALIQGSMEQFGATETVTFDRKAADSLGWRLLGR